jgi:GT2 family glycosyltransferase
MRRVAVVVVNFNSGPCLGECLKSLFRESPGLEIEVEVVDNGSTDGSPEALRRDFPEVRLIRLGRNRGFAAAANISLRRIRDEGMADYVLLLNPDTVITGEAVVILADFLESRQDVGAAGPALLLPEGRFQTGAGGFLPTAWTGLVYFLLLFKVLPKKTGSFFIDQAPFVMAGKPVEVEWISGACLMVKREVLSRAGLLDERYPLYGEDIAWGKAMRRGGVGVCFVPSARVVHHHGYSSKKDGGEANPDWLEMVYRFVRREGGVWEYGLFRFFSTMGFFMRWVGYSLAGWGGGGESVRQRARDSLRFFAYSFSKRLRPARGEGMKRGLLA